MSPPNYPLTYYDMLIMESGGLMYAFRTSVQSIVKGPLSWVKVNAKLALPGY